MIIGASSFSGNLHELKDEVESIELYIPKLNVYDGTKLMIGRIKKIKDLLSSYDMTTSIHGPYFNTTPNYPHELIVDTSQLNGTQFRLLVESIKVAENLNSKVVVIHPGRININREWSFKDMVSGLTRLAKFAEDRNVMLGLENKDGTDPKNLCCSANELIEAIKQIDSPNLKATFDIGHANLTCGGNQLALRDFLKTVKESVVHVHIHDNNGSLADKYMGDLHGAPGTGVIDFSLIDELDFNGIYNLEVFSIEDVRKGKEKLLEIKSRRNKSYSPYSS